MFLSFVQKSCHYAWVIQPKQQNFKVSTVFTFLQYEIIVISKNYVSLISNYRMVWNSHYEFYRIKTEVAKNH